MQDEDMDTAKPARKVAKVNAVAAAPSARVNKSSNASSGLMRTASGISSSSSGRNGTAAAAAATVMPSIIDELLAGGDASASPARQAAATHEVKRAEREVAKLRGQLETVRLLSLNCGPSYHARGS